MLDLMRHTSGITYCGRGTTAVHALYPASSNAAGASLDTGTFLERLAAAPLLYQPGTVWDYGLSIDVIGLVVEAISGQSLGTFLAQRLFGPRHELTQESSPFPIAGPSGCPGSVD